MNYRNAMQILFFDKQKLSSNRNTNQHKKSELNKSLVMQVAILACLHHNTVDYINNSVWLIALA